MDSVLGKGSTFRLTLPVEVLPELQEERPRDSPATTSAQTLVGRVLLVEDNAVNRMITTAVSTSKWPEAQ